MKKVLIALSLIIAAVSHQAYAQFRWGPTVGADFSSLKFSQDLFSVNTRVGAQAGIQAEMMFPGIGFGIDFGAMYEMRGAGMNLGQKLIWSSDGYGKETLTSHFLTIPIDLRFKWTRMNGFEDYIAPYIFGGPVIAFQLAHSKLPAFEYKTLDFGLQAGVGVEVMKNWQIQGAYVWGISDAVKCRKLVDFNASYRYWTVRVVRYF